MPYAYNRTAFASGRTSAASLLAIYSTLVVLELGLKEHLGVHGNGAGHDLGVMLKKAISPSDSKYWIATARLAQLRTCLGSLKCNRKDGTANLVRHQAYPDLRYVRHGQDWPNDSSTDLQLAQARQAANRLLHVCSEIGVPTT